MSDAAPTREAALDWAASDAVTAVMRSTLGSFAGGVLPAVVGPAVYRAVRAAIEELIAQDAPLVAQVERVERVDERP